MAHARSLAERLAAAGDELLTTLFARRGVSPDVTWNDFFDAAEALLAPASVERALRTLSLDEASALIGHEAPAGAARSLSELMLTQPDGSAYPTVAQAAAVLGSPTAIDTPDVGPSDDAQSAHAAERALRHVAAVADMLLSAREMPLAMLANGRASAGEKKRFAESDSVPEGTDLDDLIVLATDARLAGVQDRMLHATPQGEEWLRLPIGRRWAALAEGLRDRMPPGTRTDQGGWIPMAAWPHAHPWDPDWPVTQEGLRRRAHLLGLVADDGTEPAWATPLRRGEAADPHPLELLLPAEVDRIFLQNDLSAIAPGRLAPSLDVRLRTVAVRESASQASSYRFTAESVARALALGETETSLRDFLGEISLTGIPQPLAYLISQTAARHGLVQVSPASGSARTRIRSSDGHLIDALLVDQALRPLGLVRDGDAAVTRASPATTFWALTDARYPATLVDESGSPVAVDRTGASSVPSATADDARYAPLISRLRTRQGPDSDAAWLLRALESAVHTRALLRVKVSMPDGSTRELTLEATGLGGGRLRGRDRAADVERTLPVSSIRSAHVIDPA